MATLKMTFAGNLRRIMREKDIKARQLAMALGVSPSVVTHWRNADKFPAVENIEGICEFLGVPYAELFREGLDPNPGKLPAVEDVLRMLAQMHDLDVVPRPGTKKPPRDS